MMATLLQQWARRYLRITQPSQCSPHRRARTRAFFAHGVDKFRLSWMVEALPALIHLSLFLFFIGRLIYLFSVNYTVFCAVVWWIAVSAATYLLITVLPIFRLESPYYTPLTSLLTLFWRPEKIAKNSARGSSVGVDIRVLKRIFNSLAEDKGLDRFFQCVLGFCNSNVVKDTQHILGGLGKSTLSSALVLFLNRTWISNLVSESDKRQRFITCMKIAHVAQLPDAAWNVLAFVITKDRNRVLLSLEMGHSLRRLVNSSDQESSLCAQIFVAYIIATDQQRDEDWTELAADQLRDTLPPNVQCDYDSVLLANLIYITRQIRASRQIDTIRQIRLQSTPQIQSRPAWKAAISPRISILPHYGQRTGPNLSNLTPYSNPTLAAHPYTSPMPYSWSSPTPYPYFSPMAFPYSSPMAYPYSTPMAYPYTPQGYPLGTSQAHPHHDVSPAHPRDTLQAPPHDTPQASLFALDVHEAVSRIILPSLSKFNILHTLLVLRYDFCALWNEIVLEAQGSAPAPVQIHILIGIRNIYIDLHRDTPAAPRVFSASTADSDDILHRASSYPLCNLPGHHPHVHEVIDDTTTDTPTTISTHSIDDASSIFIPPSSSSSSSSPTPLVYSTPSPSVSTPSLSGGIPDSPEPIIIYPPSGSTSLTSPKRTHIPEDSVLLSALTPAAIPSQSLRAGAVQAIMSSPIRTPILKDSVPLPAVTPVAIPSPSLGAGAVQAIMSSPTRMPILEDNVPPPAVTPVAIPSPSLSTGAVHAMSSPIRTPIHEDSVPPPVVTPVAIPSPSLGAREVQAIKFNGYGELAALLCHSPHSILYQDELYPTALHLFEARKFLYGRPDLAERIRECERVEDVLSIRAEVADFARQDWGNVALSTVSFLIARVWGEERLSIS